MKATTFEPVAGYRLCDDIILVFLFPLYRTTVAVALSAPSQFVQGIAITPEETVRKLTDESLEEIDINQLDDEKGELEEFQDLKGEGIFQKCKQDGCIEYILTHFNLTKFRLPTNKPKGLTSLERLFD